MNKQKQIYKNLEDICKEKDYWKKDDAYFKSSTKNLLMLIKQVPHKRILEVGCAQGDFSRELKKIAKHVTAIDVSESEVKRAKAHVRNVEFIKSSFEELDGRKRYDVIVCSEVLYYILDRKGALEKLRKMGKYLVTSNFIIYFPQICIKSIQWENDLRQLPLVDRIIEKDWKQKMLVIKSLRKMQ